MTSPDGSWWDGFYADRTKPIPFFVEWPDESLAEWLAQGQLARGRVLELGSGNGRNGVFLASRGWTVDAVDFSAAAISWARQHAARAGVTVSHQCCSVFDARIPAASYDLVYDGGLGYTREALEHLWGSHLDIQQLRQMRKPAKHDRLMGEDFLWVLLAQKPAAVG